MPVAGGRQVAVQEGLEIAVCGREPGCLLDLEHQLAAGRPVRPGGDDQEVRGVGEPGGDPLRAGGVACAIGDQVGHRGSVEGTARQVGADRRRCHDRAEIADRVAPAVIELAGLDDDPCQRPGW